MRTPPAKELYTNASLSVEPRPGNRSMWMALGAFVVVFFLWQVDRDGTLMYPFRLLVTFVHETGHGLSAILTGGQFLHFQVMPNGSGETFTVGGSEFIIPQMGYLGAALYGAVLLFAANRIQRVDRLAIALGLFFGACAFFFAGSPLVTAVIVFGLALIGWLIAGRFIKNLSLNKILSSRFTLVILVVLWLLVPGLLRSMNTGENSIVNVALVSGILTGLTLIAMGILAPPSVTRFVLNVMAFVTGFNAVNDVWLLMQIPDAKLGSTPNDALATAQLTHTPTQLWVILWTALALIMMGVSIYITFIRPARHAAKQTK